MSKLLMVDFIFILSFHCILVFLFFSIFRTTQVRVYQSRGHICHKWITRLEGME